MMKLVFTFMMTILAVLTYAQSYSTQDPSYIEKVTLGEAALNAQQYDSCVIYYSAAFDIKQTSFLSLMRGAACAYSMDDQAHLNAWMDKAFVNSWGGAKNVFANYEEFDYLRGTPFEDLINERYQSAAKAAGVNLELMEEFDGILDTDQRWRRLMRDTSDAYGWGSPQMQSLWKEQTYHDSLNTARIEEVIAQYGYPGKSLVGDGHASTAFLVIQHADLAVQEKYIDLMKAAADAGEVRWASIALLVDRVNLRQGKRQIYGSQVSSDPETGEYYFSPIDMPYLVDSIRATVGLGPIQAYADNWNFTYDVNKHIERTQLIEDSQLKYLALGDSYTIGESVSENRRWSVQLATAIRERGINIAAPTIIAKTGWTTDELQNAINNATLEPKYDLVSLLIGVNNQYRGYPIAQFEKEFGALLEQAVTFAGGQKDRVFIVSIPDYGVTPFGQKKNPVKIATELDLYNHLTKKMTEAAGITFVDITPISRTATDDPTLIAEDGLHPSAAMYQQWVDMLLKEVIDIEELLSKKE